MFYSQMFLARKGPLGTVWIAAHLEHKLKKSQINSTDIPQTVELIIDPRQVPVALRMSGHLLLGVVRIYSKKVHYLHRDCNALWDNVKNSFRHTDVNLPENADKAEFNAVTLPETYALDAIDIDSDLSHIVGSQDDHHLRSQEEITLRARNHVEEQLYVRVTFNDDETFPEFLPSETREEFDTTLIEIPIPDISTAEARSQPEEQPGGSEVPPLEVMRENVADDTLQNLPILRPHDPNLNISSPKDMGEQNIDTPRSIHASPVHSLQSLPHNGPSSSSNGAHMDSDPHVNVSPAELGLRPTPTAEMPQPWQRNKRPRRHFDESLVLTNEYVKNLLRDSSSLVKKKRKLPCSAIELWRFTKKQKKNEEVFSEPLVSGMCVDLQNLSSNDLISSNPNFRVTEEAQLESTAAETQEDVPNIGEDIERLRSADHGPGLNIEPILPSTPRSSPSPSHIVEPPSSLSISSLVSEPRLGDSAVQSDIATQSGGMGMETPNLSSMNRDDDGDTASPDILESSDLNKSDELAFLELDNIPSDSQGDRTADTMSARTRAVAQYLKNHSPLSKFSDDSSENLNLSTILEGRPRKLCARMFYETLVLKDCGVIDVQQYEPYGDIILKLTPNIFKADI